MSRILVVDDEADLVKLIANVLKKAGHEVVTAFSAYEVLEKDYRFYDLILLDVMMPGMDGFELCKQIRHQVDVPIIFLTAKSMENDIMYGLGIGADDYLTKPFGTGELRARVEAHLRREQREKNILCMYRGWTLIFQAKKC